VDEKVMSLLFRTLLSWHIRYTAERLFSSGDSQISTLEASRFFHLKKLSGTGSQRKIRCCHSSLAGMQFNNEKGKHREV